jgi:hypothetical protein
LYWCAETIVIPYWNASIAIGGENSFVFRLHGNFIDIPNDTDECYVQEPKQSPTASTDLWCKL